MIFDLNNKLKSKRVGMQCLCNEVTATMLSSQVINTMLAKRYSKE